jgi:phytoene dehydrogenase-like protein
MQRYDHIVVGSGASGLTAALLLGLQRRRVLLLEKAPRIGGSLCRFRRNGVPFDTGLHFTGGLLADGLLTRMLHVLDIRDAVEPVFMDPDCAHRFVFEAEGRSFDLPQGIPAWRAKLKAAFPGEAQAVDGYFDRVERVCARTAGMDITRLDEPAERVEEDFVSLKAVLDALTANPLLKGIFSGLGMCYGVRPSEVSFATHSRVCQGLHESTARFRRGGDELIDAFAERLRALDVEIRCGAWIAGCRVNEQRIAEAFTLNTGETVAADSAVLTIHPKQILSLLPPHAVSPAFADRVSAFEPSAGFFSVYGRMDSAPGSCGIESGTIVSLFPTADFDRLLSPGYAGEQALVIIGSEEKQAGQACHAVTVLEPSFPAHVAAWRDSSRGCRPAGYEAYKAARVACILQRMGRYRPDYRGGLHVLDAASVLTYRDYLHSPDGSAYGIKQKIGQFNLFGRLPVRNLYAAGQSSLLPGLAGSMMSSFVALRSVLGRDAMGQFIQEKLRT